MKLDKPRVLAYLTALIIGAFLSVGLLILQLSGAASLQLIPVLLLIGFLCLFSFLLLRYLVNRFIYNKVKLIYKNIHELRVGSGSQPTRKSDDLDQVTREVSEWANQRQIEIQELKDRERFRREFIGNISHELKTPIFNIQGYLLTLLDGAMEDPEINQKYLKRANKSVDRMINIIEDMEVISNLESNRMNLEITSFDIVQLVRDVYELLEDKARKNKTKLLIKLDYEKPYKVMGDRQKIEQVLINLVSNAIKYGKPEKGKVEISFFDMHKNVLIEVNDDGAGIPPEDVARIFERFYRVDKSRSREAGGTGLGLSIVKHILETHQQSISVRSNEKGTTFSFTLKKSK